MPVCVEMVPTVMEVGVTPGALLDVSASAVPTGSTRPSVTVAAPVRTAPTTERYFQLALITPPIVGQRYAEQVVRSTACPRSPSWATARRADPRRSSTTGFIAGALHSLTGIVESRSWVPSGPK